MEVSPEHLPLLGQEMPLWKRIISIEPAIIFFYTANTMSSFTLQNWLLQMNKYNSSSNGTFTSELDSEADSSEEFLMSTIISNLLCVVPTVTAGPMVDRNLKYLAWFICLPLFGQALCDAINCLNVLFLYLNGFVTALYNGLILGVYGSPHTFIVMCSFYIAHSSLETERTIRMIYLIFAKTIGLSISYFLSGFFNKFIGILYCYLFCLLLETCAIITVLAFIHTKNCTYSNSFGEENTGSFSLSLMEGIEVLKKQRPDNKKTGVIVLFIIYGILYCYPSGESSVLFLFLKSQFKWSHFTYKNYDTILLVLLCIGAVFTAEILKRLFKLQDVIIGLLGATMEVLTAFSLLVMNREWQIYAILVLRPFHEAVQSVTFSLASKYVEPQEYGRLYSIFGATAVFLPVFIFVYKYLYESTNHIHPQVVFLLSACLTTAVFSGFSYLFYKTRCKDGYTSA